MQAFVPRETSLLRTIAYLSNRSNQVLARHLILNPPHAGISMITPYFSLTNNMISIPFVATA